MHSDHRPGDPGGGRHISVARVSQDCPAGLRIPVGLPVATPNPAYVDIQAYSTAPSSGQLLWDTAITSGNTAGNCQVYISDWTDTAISLLVGMPPNAVNFANMPLSPLTDMSPLSFFQQAPASSCPVAAGNYVQVTVKNPQQSQNSFALAIAQNILQTTGTTPF